MNTTPSPITSGEALKPCEYVADWDRNERCYTCHCGDTSYGERMVTKCDSAIAHLTKYRPTVLAATEATSTPSEQSKASSDALTSGEAAISAAMSEANKLGVSSTVAARIVAAYRAITEATSTPSGEDDIKQVYDLIGVGEQARTIGTLMVSLRNMMRFSDMLHAVEREFFMVPGEPNPDYPDEEPDDECMVHCWGATVEQYVEQFRAALAQRASAPGERPTASGAGDLSPCPCCPQAIRNLHAVAHNICTRNPRIHDGELKRAVDQVKPLMDAHFADPEHSHGAALSPHRGEGGKHG